MAPTARGYCFCDGGDVKARMQTALGHTSRTKAGTFSRAPMKGSSGLGSQADSAVTRAQLLSGLWHLMGDSGQVT